MLILAPIAAGLLQMSLSRSREYQADASGAHLSHDGEPLARALEKIEAYAKQVPMNVAPAQAQAYIVNPLTGRKVRVRQLVQHAPAHRRAHRPAAQRPVLSHARRVRKPPGRLDRVRQWPGGSCSSRPPPS